MRQHFLFGLTLTLIVSSVSAQTRDDGFAIWPGRDGVGCTTFTSRTDTLWAQGGEMC